MKHPMWHDFFANENLNQLYLLQDNSSKFKLFYINVHYQDGGSFDGLCSAVVVYSIGQDVIL